MHFNAGPWANLFRTMPLGKLAGLGTLLTAGSLALLFMLPRSGLRLVAPLLAVALGLGGGALLVALGRLIWAGGRWVRIGAAVVLALAIVGGTGVWYVGRVAFKSNHACRAAVEDRARWYRDDKLVECRERTASLGFTLAKQFSDVSEAEKFLPIAEDDAKRVAAGLCPRHPITDEPCRCGAETFPETRLCAAPTCALRDGVERLRCD